MKARSKRALEIVFEISVGLLLVVVAYVWATTRPDDDTPIKWFAFLGLTLLLFGYPVYWARTHLGNAAWWLCWTLFLSLHLVLVGLFVATAPVIPLVVFLLIGLAEASLIIPVLLKIEAREESKKRGRKQTRMI